MLHPDSPSDPSDPPLPPVWDWALQYSKHRRDHFTQPVSPAPPLQPLLNGNLNTSPDTLRVRRAPSWCLTPPCRKNIYIYRFMKFNRTVHGVCSPLCPSAVGQHHRLGLPLLSWYVLLSCQPAALAQQQLWSLQEEPPEGSLVRERSRSGEAAESLEPDRVPTRSGSTLQPSRTPRPS